MSRQHSQHSEEQAVSSLYHKLEKAEASTCVDAAVLKMAANELAAKEPRPRRAKAKYWSKWPFSGSIAAALILVAITLTTYEQADTDFALEPSEVDDTLALSMSDDALETNMEDLPLSKEQKQRATQQLEALLVLRENNTANELALRAKKLSDEQQQEVARMIDSELQSEKEQLAALASEAELLAEPEALSEFSDSSPEQLALIDNAIKQSYAQLASLLGIKDSESIEALEVIRVSSSRLQSATDGLTAAPATEAQAAEVLTRNASEDPALQKLQNTLFENLLVQKQQRNDWKLEDKFKKVLSDEQVQKLAPSSTQN
ncbi:hypothetical protein ISG33_08015 [Glaciecola sp. MH2013]|uniref:hypothetical protein n=1 Tax=Glaciecola sp. MH2013 TaxID=2785524 RepID=UPI0018A036EA|nr:hypothetical protein [Glaciecola sp. MH2013]MBF7073338.1 hypothetical protein [Glaciecola sp. MH2013]